MKLNRNHLILCVLLFSCFLNVKLFAQEFAKQTPDDRTEQLLLGAPDTPPASGNRTATPTSTGHLNGLSTQKVNACATAFIMNTPYNSNNGQRGCMFDILAANAVTINCFDVNLYAGTTANYEIYYHAGTHVGSENNAAAWTLLGSATGITSAGNNVPTALPITFNVTIPAGARYSFYITNDFGGGTSYTDGTAVGNFLAADANITVYEGVGKSYPFGLTFAVRNFNGHIFYNSGGPLDANPTALRAHTQGSYIRLDWEVQAEAGLLAQSLQRSEDGEHFSELHRNTRLDGAAAYSDHSVQPGVTYYYRLQNLGANGQVAYSEVVSMTLPGKEDLLISEVQPNPFGDQLNFNLYSQQTGMAEVLLLDAMGRTALQTQVFPESGSQSIQLATSNLRPGIYSLVVRNGKSRQVKKLIHL